MITRRCPHCLEQVPIEYTFAYNQRGRPLGQIWRFRFKLHMRPHTALNNIVCNGSYNIASKATKKMLKEWEDERILSEIAR